MKAESTSWAEIEASVRQTAKDLGLDEEMMVAEARQCWTDPKTLCLITDHDMLPNLVRIISEAQGCSLSYTGIPQRNN